MEYNASEGYFGEDDPDATDKEWDDFAKLVEKNVNHRNKLFILVHHKKKIMLAH